MEWHSIGRFTQEDVYRGDGLNLYAYCGNNPVFYYDPSGYSGCGNKGNNKNTNGVGNTGSRAYDPSKPLSPSNYPNPDPDFSVPPVRYEPKTIEEVERMRRGLGPTTKATHGDRNIEAHHRGQKSVKNGGILDDLEEYTHRRGGNHTRHTQASELTPAQRKKEIREYWKKRGSEYVLPGEGI